MTTDLPAAHPDRGTRPGPFGRALRTVRDNLGAYLVVNAVMYGLSIAGFVTALLFPELNAAQVASLQADGTADLVLSLLGNVWLFVLVILGVTTVTVGALSILLPSMIVPFAGIAVFAYRAFDIGLTLAPADRTGWVVLVPHSLTYLIEFQAYVLLVLGAHLLGRSWLRPASVGAPNRRAGYVSGLRQIGRLSLPALVLFVVGAVYEAFTLSYLVPVLVQAMS